MFQESMIQTEANVQQAINEPQVIIQVADDGTMDIVRQLVIEGGKLNKEYNLLLKDFNHVNNELKKANKEIHKANLAYSRLAKVNQKLRIQICELEFLKV